MNAVCNEPSLQWTRRRCCLCGYANMAFSAPSATIHSGLHSSRSMRHQRLDLDWWWWLAWITLCYLHSHTSVSTTYTYYAFESTCRACTLLSIDLHLVFVCTYSNVYRGANIVFCSNLTNRYVPEYLYKTTTRRRLDIRHQKTQARRAIKCRVNRIKPEKDWLTDSK